MGREAGEMEDRRGREAASGREVGGEGERSVRGGGDEKRRREGGEK